MNMSIMGALKILLISVLVVMLSSCAAPSYQEPIQSGLTVWPYLGLCYPGSGCYRTQQFDLYVGIPAENIAVGAKCYDGSGQTATWYGNLELVSGQLPPGLEFDFSGLSVFGVPTRAGTWHFRVRFTGVTCNGQSYDAQLANYYQDVTIKTSGN